MTSSLRKPVVGFILLTLLGGGAAFAEGKIATIDLNKAFSNYWKKKEAEANLKDLQADMEKDFKIMLDDLKKAQEAYQKLRNDASDQAVSVDEREKRKKLAEDKLKQAKELDDAAAQYNRQATTRLDEQSKRVRDSILSEIKTVVNAKAKAAGYSLVIDVAAETRNFTPVILFNNNEFDITDAVLDQLNAAAPGTANSASTPKADEKKKDAKDQKKGK
jgi:outer membrane protein